MRLRFGSVCAGIEAASVAFEPLGWSASWFSEIEPFASRLLAHHYPTVPNLGDMTELDPEDLTDIDILIGGTPCQSFSISGYRNGLDDDRGNLALSFVRIADAIDDIRQGLGHPPIVTVWENVPGVLSTGGNPFGCFLGALCGEDVELKPTGDGWTNAGCVFGPRRSIAWRSLDAQYFGLAQRRQRVFVVASARKDIDPGQILFEFQGVRRDIEPSRKKRPGVTDSTLQGPQTGRQLGFGADKVIDHDVIHCLTDHERFGEGEERKLVPVLQGPDLANALMASGVGVGGPDVSEAEGNHLIPFDPTEVTSSENRSRCDPGAPCPTLKTHARPMAIAWTQDVAETLLTREYKTWTLEGNMFRTRNVTAMGAGVRRLLPTECEILMGFPRDYTAIPYPKKAIAKDAPRYRALGNSMAVPVVRWIGHRINQHLEEQNGRKQA